jgi:glycosyltransferase involved in cell wall biosynthesis
VRTQNAEGANQAVSDSEISRMTRPRISVCIPAYNHEKYIGDCINSVLGQTFSDFEIVVTDDCSKDGTVEVVKSFSDPRIRLFRLARNQGPSVAANNNFREARGDFLCPLASDDLFHPEKLERQLAFLESNPEVGVAFSYVRYVDERRVEIPDHFGYRWVEVGNRSREMWLRSFFYQGNSLSAPTAMIRRSVLDKIGLVDPRLLQTQDFDLWIRVCLLFEVHVIPERLIDYRVRDGQQNASSATPFKQAQAVWELSKIFERYAEIEDRAFFDRIFPESVKPEHESWPLKAKLAMVAMNAEAPHIRAFGLNLMYELLGDEETAGVITSGDYGFPSFFRSVGEVDVFEIASRADLLSRLSDQSHELRGSREELNQIRASRSWRLTSGVHYLSTLLRRGR